MKLASFVALAALLLASSSLFAKPVDLSEFAGKFKGTTTFVMPGEAYFGTSQMVFKVAKNGTRGSLAVSANFTAAGTPYNVSNNFGFAKNKRLTIAALLPPLALVPASGAYSVKRGVAINGSGTHTIGSSTYFVTLSVVVKRTSKRATLTAIYNLYSEGIQIYQTTYVGTQKLKK
jgi:hypothetical protein